MKAPPNHMTKITVRTQMDTDTHSALKKCAEVYNVTLNSVIEVALKAFVSSDIAQEYYPKAVAGTKKQTSKPSPSQPIPTTFTIGKSDPDCYLDPGAPNEGLYPAWHVWSVECPPDLIAQLINEADTTAPKGYWLIGPNDWAFPVYNSNEVRNAIQAWLDVQ